MNFQSIQLSVEFDNTDDLATSLVADAASIPETGDVVELIDGEGNRCYATVVRVTDDLIYADVIWASWRPTPVVELSALDMLTDLAEAVLDAQYMTSNGEKPPVVPDLL